MVELPRYVIAKRLSTGATNFYFNVPLLYRKRGCPVRNEPLGADYGAMVGRARTLNGLVDEWLDARRGLPVIGEAAPRIGSVDWLFREYRASNAYTEKVSKVSRPSYEKTMRMVGDTLTKKGDRVGSRPIKSITPRGADKLYERFIQGKKDATCLTVKRQQVDLLLNTTVANHIGVSAALALLPLVRRVKVTWTRQTERHRRQIMW